MADHVSPTTIEDLVRATQSLGGPNTEHIAAARARDEVLTKPAGSLGRLEEIALWYAGWRGCDDLGRLQSEGCRGQALIFAGNHGVASRGVSAYPSDVTAQMVANFRAGGAAINQLCRQHGVALAVSPIDLERPTADFTTGPAMSEYEFLAALILGFDAVDPDADALILGEMGIGNTTAATAIALALFNGDLDAWTGRGTGVDDAGLARKRDVIRAALDRHAPAINAAGAARGFEAARRLGGRELAAILGACLRARQLRQVVLIDGLISTAAVAPLFAVNSEALAHTMAAHASVEPAHRALLQSLRLDPLLDLGLRLGEGSGAALAFGLLQSALRLHAGMSTFEEAAVSGPAEAP